MRNIFKTVYCEDCKNCLPDDGKGGIGGAGPMCKAYPIEVDCSEVDTYVKKNRKVRIIKSYKRCYNIRVHKRMPLIFCSYCFKFSSKQES